MKLFFDIETIPAGEKLAINDVNPPGNMSKPETIAKWYQEQAPGVIEEEYRKRSVIPYRCQVICLAMAIDDESPLCHIGSEEEIFKSFNDSFKEKVSSQQEAVTWVGFNIKGFDLPIVRQRAFKYNLEHLKLNHLKKYDNRIFDIMERFLFPATGYISMKEVAEFLGVKVKEGIDGSKVYDMWLSKREQDIYDYCTSDVVATRDIYSKMSGY